MFRPVIMRCALGVIVMGAPVNGLAMQDSPDASFRGLGDLPGGDRFSQVFALSADGRVAVGYSRTARSGTDAEAFWWTGDRGMRALGGLARAPYRSQPLGISADGRVVVGHIATDAVYARAIRWTLGPPNIEVTFLAGEPPSSALGVSPEGRSIVGWAAVTARPTDFEAVRWETAGTRVPIGDLPGGRYRSAAALVSGGGAVVVGTANTAAGSETFRWTAGGGLVALGDLAGGDVASEPFAMTSDAMVIVGQATSESGVEAARWTAADGWVALGDLPGGDFFSTALGADGEGILVAGFGHSPRGKEAVVWVEGRLHTVSSVLASSGVGADGWTLTEAVGVSADGRTLVGNGVNPAGWPEAWVARLPRAGR